MDRIMASAVSAPVSFRTLIVAAHPDIGNSTVHAAWLRALRQAAVADVHEIVAIYPDGVLDVRNEQRLIEAHSRIILQFPIFWYSVPAVLKNWIDQVLSHGWAYGRSGDGFAGKELGLAYSTGTAAEAYQAGGRNRFSMSELTKPLELTAIFIKARFLPSFVLHGANAGFTEQDLEESARAYVAHVAADF
jgi:glutathione-regulated potassium-efflux system ancillary protein KefG